MVRILLSGAVDNSWDVLYARIEKLNALAEKKKTARFDLLVCIGKVGALPEAYTIGKAQIPIKTYCIPAYECTPPLSTSKSKREDEEALEVVPNWFLLIKPYGILEIEGIKIAYLTGVSPEVAQAHEIKLSSETVKELLTQVKSEKLDFFFSAELPNGYSDLSNVQVPPQLSSYCGSMLIREIMQEIRPRYHITAAIHRAEALDESAFYERIPYATVCGETNERQITRLINLCSVNDIVKDKNKKYLHALHITETSGQEVEATRNPYIKLARSAEQDCEHTRKVQKVSNRFTAARGPSQFFFDTSASGGRGPPIKERTECWFCLATPELERHLIVSIGQEAYLALPKGGLSQDHVLIIPIVHEKSTVQLSPSCREEMDRFKIHLQRMFAAERKEMIVFDRNVHSIGASHCHMQVIGIPPDRSSDCTQVFETEGAKYNVTFERLAAEEDLNVVVEDRPFFYAEMPAMDQEARDSERSRCRLLHIVRGKHYMQFGRHVVATLLGCPRRANWKYCVVDKNEETLLTQQFKNRWKPFDFTTLGH